MYFPTAHFKPISNRCDNITILIYYLNFAIRITQIIFR